MIKKRELLNPRHFCRALKTIRILQVPNKMQVRIPPLEINFCNQQEISWVWTLISWIINLQWQTHRNLILFPLRKEVNYPLLLFLLLSKYLHRLLSRLKRKKINIKSLKPILVPVLAKTQEISQDKDLKILRIKQQPMQLALTFQTKLLLPQTYLKLRVLVLNMICIRLRLK